MMSKKAKETNALVDQDQLDSLTTFKRDDGQLQVSANTIDALPRATGSDHEGFQDLAIDWLFQALPERVKNTDHLLEGSLALLQGIEPKNEMEAMLAAQMIAAHFCGLEMARRTQIFDQTRDTLVCNSNMTNKFMRTFCAQMETLNKIRNGGKQTIQVQHVNVKDGGQAIVGNVETGGG